MPNKPQSPLVGSTPAQETLNDSDMTGCKAETENIALAGVMDLLIDMSSHLEATEHGMDELGQPDSPYSVQCLHLLMISNVVVHVHKPSKQTYCL